MAMDLMKVLAYAKEKKASDLHVTVNRPPVLRIRGELLPLGEEIMNVDEVKELAYFLMGPKQQATFEEFGEVDFSWSQPNINRYRVNAYRQRNSCAIAMRMISNEIPTFEEIRLPEIFKELAMKPRGLFLVTGPTGSGKSTTLAAMVGHINENRRCHVITIEDPIEYMHKHNLSLVNQREVGDDTTSFARALRSALREDPDVILVGEMRDYETISTAMTAAETGHFVMSTLHTTTAAMTIDRIIDSFPPHQQSQIKGQLSTVLEGIVTQQLVRTADRQAIVPVFEILIANDAVRNLIREGKISQIDTVIQTNIKNGMVPMDYSLAQLVKENVITREDAEFRCVDKEIFFRYLRG